IPAVIGMFVVAEPFYTIFYSFNAFGIHVTRIYAVTSLFMGLFLVLGNILQAVNLRRLGIYALGAGILVKLIAQPLFLSLVGESGMLYSTMTGLLVTIFFMFRAMYKNIGFSIPFIFRRLLLILVLALIMGVVTFASSWVLGLFINHGSRLQALISMLITGATGVIVYGYLTLKTR